MSEPAGAGLAVGTHRLHPSSLVLCLIEDLRKWILPLVLVLFLGAGRSWELWLMVWIAPNMAWETLRYVTMRYRIAGGELVLREGLLEKKERHIPFARIQNIDLVQGPLQRLIGVAEVRIETASGSEAEAVLRFLALADVEAMRARVFAGRPRRGPSDEPAAGDLPGRGEAAQERPTRTLLALTWIDLVGLGLSVNRGVAAIAAGLGLAWEFDLRERVSTDWLEAWVDTLDRIGLTVLGLAVLLMIAGTSFFLSVLVTIVRLHGFRLERRGREFHLSCGLLTRHHATIPGERIQLVSIHEGIVQRLIGTASVRVETAGGSEGEVASLARRWFMPSVPRERLPDVLAQVVPGFDLRSVEWRPLARGAVARSYRLALVLALATGAGCSAMKFPHGGLVVLALLPLLLLATFLDLRFKRWARPPGAIAFREGAFWHKTSFTFVSRVHVVKVAESPFDRRWGMASLGVDTAGAGIAQHKIRIPYLPRELADDTRRGLAAEAESVGFHW